MKWTIILLLFLLSACAQWQRFPSSEDEVRHVVFDIDWTIVSEIKKDSPKFTSKRIVKVGEHEYFINEGLEEFIQNILDKKDVKISFYSGGPKSRNDELLSKIKLKDNRSLKDIAFKILSYEDLVSVDASSNAFFAERFKKDLSKVSKNLDQLIMFDDTYNFVMNTHESQSDHVFFIGSAFEHYENYQDTKGRTGKFVPKSHDEWLLDKKKLFILNGAFNEAYNESRTGEITLSEAMKKKEDLLDLKSHQWNEHSKRYYTNHNQTDFSVNIQEPLKCGEGLKVLMGF